jgi:hypothetical protein
MQKSKIYRLVGLAVALAATLALVLVNRGPTVAKADELGRERRPYTTTVQCLTDDWNDEICFKNIAPIPARKRFVVEYVTVVAYTDKDSDQKLSVNMTFVTGSSPATYFVVNPVLHYQMWTPPGLANVNWYQASEKVLAFAEKTSTMSGQLYVTRSPVPVSGYPTKVTLWATGYLEDK